MHTAYINIPSCQQCFVQHFHYCISQESAFPCIQLCFFVPLRQCMLWARIGRPVQSAVFCCPGTHGSVVFSCSLMFVPSRVCRIVMYVHQSICICQLSFVLAVSCEALTPVYQLKVCIPVHFTVFL